MTAELAVGGQPVVAAHLGTPARRVVEESREQLAAALGRRAGEVVLTGGGTEADNLAVKGLYWSRRAGRRPAAAACWLSAVEHHAVLDGVEWLGEHEGAEVVWLPGRRRRAASTSTACASELAARTRTHVALVTVMWANNEVGTVQPVAEVVAAARRARRPGAHRRRAGRRATAGRLRRERPGRPHLSGHKLGGPVGAGALLLRRGRRPGAGAARRRAGARGPLRHARRAVRGRARGRRRARRRATAPRGHPARRAARRASWPASWRRARRRRARRPRPAGPAARQRPRHLPRLRGRLPAVPARRPRRRVLDRVGLPGGRPRSRATCWWRWASPAHEARGALRFCLGHTSTEADVGAWSPRSGRSSSGPAAPG